MEMMPVQQNAGAYAMSQKYPLLIRLAMRERRINKTTLWKAKVIKQSTWKKFDRKLDEGTITVTEMFAILEFLEIGPVRAAITCTSLSDVSQYFDTTSEVASDMAIEMAISLTEKASAIEGNFNPMKQIACKAFANRLVTDLIERNEAINAAMLARP